MSEIKMTTSRKAIGGFIIVASVAILAFVVLSATASAGVITVPSAGNETIQQAINNASDGDTILVNATAYAGTTETVDVTQSNIVIRSVSGRAVIDANGADDHVVDITDQTNVTLDGFTIRDARNTLGGGYVAGIYMENASECTISNVIVTNISATLDTDVYGIRLNDSHNNTFSSNTSVFTITSEAYPAYGIWLGSSTDNTFNSSIFVSNVTGNTACGIYLAESSNNEFSSSITVSTITATNDNAYGIWLETSSSNIFSSSTSVSNITATEYVFGLFLRYSSNNNIFSPSTSVSNITGGDYVYGIWLYYSNNNAFSSSTSVSNITATDGSADGIRLHSSSNNAFSSSTSVSNITANQTAYGIRLGGSDDNNFTGVTITPTINGSESYEFWSDANCNDNVVTDMTLGNPTTISFTYGNGIWIKRVEAAERPTDPQNFKNIGKYINASNVTANSWLFVNVSYDQNDVIGVDETSLRLYRWNGTAWELLPQPNGVNTVEDYVYANITTFSQIAAFGNPSARVPTLTPIGLIALVSLLAALAVLTMRRKRR